VSRLVRGGAEIPSLARSVASCRCRPAQIHHRAQGVFNGQRIGYTVTIAETIVKDASGHPACSAFTIAYIAKKVKDPAKRPVIFIFNGGPGSASNTLLFGAFGPKRMERFTSAALADPSTPLVDNPYTVRCSSIHRKQGSANCLRVYRSRRSVR
jgi:carboxypeptidase C (cathepsin A)